MLTYSKKDKIISISIILTSVIFIFSAQLNLARADDLPVIDQTQIDVSNKIEDTSNRIAALLAGEENKGAEYFRIEAGKKLEDERALLKKLTESIINMINTGNNGAPMYVTNINQYFTSTSNSTINNFQDDPALDSVCEPYKDGVKQAAGQVSPTFQEKIECSIDPATLADFNNGEKFNWDSWVKITTIPKNNYLGAELIAIEEQQNRIDDNIEAAKLEASWGNGFTSIKVCNPANANPDMGYDGCDIKTPGEVIANRLNTADITNIEQMQRATDYNELTLILTQSTAYSNPGSLSKPKGLQTGSTGGVVPPVIPPIVPPVLPPIIPPVIPPPGGGGTGGTVPDYNTDGTINFNSCLGRDNNGQTTVDAVKALRLIDIQITTEIQYYNAQNNIYDLIDLTQTSFASSTAQACTETIKNPIINQIIGYPAYDQTNFNNLSWNVESLNI